MNPKGFDGNYWTSVLRFMMNSVGGPLGATAGAWSEAEQARINAKIAALLQMEQEKFREMFATLCEVEARVAPERLVNRILVRDETVGRDPGYLRRRKTALRLRPCLPR